MGTGELSRPGFSVRGRELVEVVMEMVLSDRDPDVSARGGELGPHSRVLDSGFTIDSNPLCQRLERLKIYRRIAGAYTGSLIHQGC